MLPATSIFVQLDQNKVAQATAGFPDHVRTLAAQAVYDAAKNGQSADHIYVLGPDYHPQDNDAQLRVEELRKDPSLIAGVIAQGPEITFNDGSVLRIFPAREFNTEALDPSVIPVGPYCYGGNRPRRENEPEFTEDGRTIRYLKYCPYMGMKTLNGVQVTWCNFLGKGDIGNNCSDEDHARLVEHFGSQEALDKGLPLFLLWDSCKECGINEESE
jgi:hypothetical protein